MRSGAATALLLVAVALAFADSSIVVLALPELLDRFDTEIAPVSWVITSYNLALALGALAAGRLQRRVGPRTVVLVGSIVFAAASGACALADSLWLLVAFRAVQGIGGALVLVGALPLLGIGGARRWAAAAALGAVAGPALGGALTEAFDWRAIFVAQAPVALLALAAPRPGGEPSARLASNTVLQAPRANLALALMSGALVGALFLVVVLLVNAWRLSPLEAAGIVTALPLGTLAAGRIPGADARAGLVLLAGGLAGLALLPGDAAAWPVVALLLCGVGTGLAAPGLARAALDAGGAAASVAWRHLGLVVALVAVAPLLAADLDSGGERARLVGTKHVLDAPIELETKVPLALDLVKAIDRAPRGQLPDFAPEFAKQPRTAPLQALEEKLDETLRAIVTRSFRNSFFVCCAFALLALVPVAVRRRRR